MEELSEKLFSILSSEIKLYEEFLNLLQEEKVKMLSLALDDLAWINQKKETVFLRIKIIEETRGQVIKKISQKLQCPSEEVCISYLSEVLPSKAKDRLNNYRNRLVSLFSAIKDLNQLNGFLSERASSYIEDTLLLLKNMAYTDPVYSAKGRLGELERSGQMISARG